MIYQLKMLVFQSDVRLPEAKRRCSSSILRIGYPKILVHHVPRPKNFEKYVFPDKPRFYIVGCIRNVPWHTHYVSLRIITYPWSSNYYWLYIHYSCFSPLFNAKKRPWYMAGFSELKQLKPCETPCQLIFFVWLNPFVLNGYPLVNVNKKLWKITMLLMGKFTINDHFQ